MNELALNDFSRRHIAAREQDIAAMLEVVGQPSLDDLVGSIVPASIRIQSSLQLPDARSEEEALGLLRGIAAENRLFKNYIGMGYYDSITPGVIQRNVLENPAWYTAYTPYQSEISQGRLEALLNFQTMVCDLTGMDVANASLLDEATAAAEAMSLARRASKSCSNVFFASSDCHPQTLEVLRTRAEPLGIEIRVGDDLAGSSTEAFGLLVQYPCSTGELRDYSALAAACKKRGSVVVAATDLLALTLLRSPGEWGADVVIGSTQRFGVPLGFGGPHAAFFSCKTNYTRLMPGRLVGASLDAQGAPAYRLTLQTREQHIRRDKATSNICTAQVLLAVMAGMYAVYHGPAGLKRIATRVHRLAAILADGLRAAGHRVNDHFFDTVTVRGIDAAQVHAAAREKRLNLRELGGDAVGISLDETTTLPDVETLWSLFGLRLHTEKIAQAATGAIPDALARTSSYLEHPVFNSYHAEHEMLRYLRELADKDLALDRTMIPLGSCTMKLNATAEMIPISWPQFGGLHPYAPKDQPAGYRRLIADLENMLAECTGYDAVSLQPNSGAQGEYAGLLAIRAYHRARGQGQRDVCLIPESAHGTNPASAQMCGMKVVPVRCDAAGNVDVADLKTRSQLHAQNLAALMITYPSTHGVFEESLVEICEIIHRHGGQVYADGANLNALVGLVKLGACGPDVSHLNLHKTFCIPHGGGGPGIGPVAVKSHLAPYLPGTIPGASPAGAVGMVAAAPFGSAGILPIPWMYITMMGGAGLKRATQVALLNANYIARRLEPYYPVLYAGRDGYVAHECILDLRPIKEACGISAEDVAKRLIDYGFHSPTLSFPVSGTLMVEPTESEPKAELDRFIDSMIAIRAEIRLIEQGRMSRQDNPLVNAPHTAAMVMAEHWTHAYSREQAAFPMAALRKRKYWPPVARVDNLYGDRNPMCTCIPMLAHAAEGRSSEGASS